MAPMDRLVIVGNVSEDPFAIDVGHAFGQQEDFSDLISLKNFANGEFCPRFISDEQDLAKIGNKLKGKTVVIVSVDSDRQSRQTLAQRNYLIARAAKDNGADKVVLVEPDLFYSAQDRGPRRNQGNTAFDRDINDYKKFDGQPFTALLYAQLLKAAGVDGVATIHNHSSSVQDVFHRVFEGDFTNLAPAEVYAHYLKHSDMVELGESGEDLVLCSPDKGAYPFVQAMQEAVGLSGTRICKLNKERTGERRVEVTFEPDSEVQSGDLQGKDVIVFDDMVRTGSTIVQACETLRQGNPRRILFCVSHFYSSVEGRENLASSTIDEILTLNTLPQILNRDTQGRLRKKLVVLKVEKWISRFLRSYFDLPPNPRMTDFYSVDMSSKNPRWKPNMRP